MSPVNPDALGGTARPWTVSLQLHMWTSMTVEAADIDEAMALAEDHARCIYGDDIFINKESTEVL